MTLINSSANPELQTRPQALKHYSDKVEYIRTNLETLEGTIQKKRENVTYLVNVMQSKLQAQATVAKS